jgi:hypothetical protein
VVVLPATATPLRVSTDDEPAIVTLVRSIVPVHREIEASASFPTKEVRVVGCCGPPPRKAPGARLFRNVEPECVMMNQWLTSSSCYGGPTHPPTTGPLRARTRRLAAARRRRGARRGRSPPRFGARTCCLGRAGRAGSLPKGHPEPVSVR